MINNHNVLLWFCTLFAIAAGGAAGSVVSMPASLLFTVVAWVTGFLSINMGWATRDSPGKNKPLSDAVAALGLAAFAIVMVLQNLVIALGVLLFFAQLAMNLVMREYRQLYFGLVVSFVYVLAGAAESKSGSYLLIFVLYGLSTSYCLGEAWLDSKTNVVNTLDAPSVWPRLKVAGSILTFALIIYLVMPRLPAVNLGSQQFNTTNEYTSKQWEREARKSDRYQEMPPREGGEPGKRSSSKSGGKTKDEAYRYAGFQDRFDIQKAGGEASRNSNAVVAYMKAPHGTYLKVRTFDTFDGARWSTSTNKRRKKLLKAGKVDISNKQANFQQVIDIEITMSAFLPAAPQPVSIWIPASVIALDTWQQPILPGPLRAGTRYTVESALELIGRRPFAGDKAPSEEDLQLPEDFDPRIGQLAREVTRHTPDAIAIATALEQHLRTAYEYSFQSVFDSQGVTPLSRFLFEEKQGHCEYFASAMTIMLRSLDIPARLVTGFSATQKNPLTGFYEIRALDGHAWVEAWIEGVGWVTFEPTAFYELPVPREETLSAEQINDYVKSLQRTDEALGREDFSFTAFFAATWQLLYTFVVAALSYLKLFFLEAWPYLLAVVLFIATVYLTRGYWLPVFRIRHSHWRIHRHNPQEAQISLRFYLYHLQLIAGYHGITRAPEETIDAWSERLAACHGVNEDFSHLSCAVNRSFYQQDGVDLDELRQVVLRIAAVLRTGD